MVGPLIEARLNMDPSQWPVSPLHSAPIALLIVEPRCQDDFITWLLTSAPESERTVDGIIRRLLNTNFAAIHTSSLGLGHTLYWLLARYGCPTNSPLQLKVLALHLDPSSSHLYVRKLKKPLGGLDGRRMPSGKCQDWRVL
jgi:hypothetical protein